MFCFFIIPWTFRWSWHVLTVLNGSYFPGSCCFHTAGWLWVGETQEAGSLFLPVAVGELGWRKGWGYVQLHVWTHFRRHKDGLQCRVSVTGKQSLTEEGFLIFKSCTFLPPHTEDLPPHRLNIIKPYYHYLKFNFYIIQWRLTSKYLTVNLTARTEETDVGLLHTVAFLYIIKFEFYWYIFTHICWMCTENLNY